MKKTLILAFAATSFTLAGCADETPADVDTTVIEAPAEAMPMDTMSTMEGGMEADTMSTMEGGAMETAPMEGETMADTTTAM